MNIRALSFLFLALCIVSCAPLSDQVGTDVAPQIRTDVAVQVGTEVALQLANIAEPDSTVSIAVLATYDVFSDGTETPFDCVSKTCGRMASCEEAVYKLYVCGDTARDANNDGVPCESLCKGSNVPAIATSYAGISPTSAPTLPPGAAETGLVTRVVDGDTIDVMLNGVNTRIRYLQMNTPERDHPCFRDSSKANEALVAGKTVRLVPDKELADPYDRLLRFVYVDDVLVNRVLVEQGWAEVVLYPPNDLHYDEFLLLEKEAAAAGRGCHPTGIFDDGSTTR